MIKCPHCKDSHKTVAQVRTCAIPPCRHDLPAGQCITCAPYNHRFGGREVTSTWPPQPRWDDPEITGFCSICRTPIYVKDRICNRHGSPRWAHKPCFADPGRIIEDQQAYRNQDADNPFHYSEVPDQLSELLATADALLPEVIGEEAATTVPLLKQVAQDMDYDLSIALIQETIYGYDLEQLGAWEPRDPDVDLEDIPALEALAERTWT